MKRIVLLKVLSTKQQSQRPTVKRVYRTNGKHLQTTVRQPQELVQQPQATNKHQTIEVYLDPQGQQHTVRNKMESPPTSRSLQQ